MICRRSISGLTSSVTCRLRRQSRLCPGAHAAHRRSARGGADEPSSVVRRPPLVRLRTPQRVVHGGIDHLLGAEVLGEFSAFGGDVDADYARAHDHPSWSPTGPRGLGRTRRVSRRPEVQALSAPQAVPVPQEMAAPASKDSASGNGMSVYTGTFI